MEPPNYENEYISYGSQPRLRASILLHVSGLIGRLMQLRKVHVGFLIRWRRVREEREQNCCFAIQPPHKLKFRTTRPLSHYSTSCCYATHNISFFYTQIMELCVYYETAYKTTHCMYCLFLHLKMVSRWCGNMRPSIRLDQCTCPYIFGIWKVENVFNAWL